MLGFFPDPHPDELLYSACARYKDRTKYPNQMAAAQELFASQNVNVAVDFPHRLDRLVANLPLFHTYTADRLIDDNTLFPVYAPFLPLTRAQVIREEMKGDSSNHVRERLGIKNSSIKTPSHLRFCPTCVEEDRTSDPGEAYWHRVHQIGGVDVCHLHGAYLEASDVPWPPKYASPHFASAERTIRNVAPRLLNTQSKQDEFLIRIAREAAWLLRWRGPIPGKDVLRTRYYNLLLERGYAYYNGRTRTTKLLNALEEFYSPDFLVRINSSLKNKWNNWLLRLVWQGRVTSVHHPLHHILLILFLGRTVEEVLTSPCEYKPFGDGPWPCLNPASHHYGKLLVKSCAVTDGVNHTTIGKPVGTFSCKCGFIYNRTKPDSADEDRFRKDNVVCYGKVWEERLRKLWLDDSISLEKIAGLLGIIQFSVKRHALRLGLPRDRGYKRARPTSEVVYKRYSNFREALPDGIQTRRAEWLSATKANPTASRTELISLVNYTYYFLRRHDREWLEANQPPSRKPPPPPQKVNWKEEDAKLAAAVKLAAVKIIKTAGRPVRVSKASIIREVGHQSWIEQHLHDLPRTARVLAKHLESHEDFLIRRVSWAEHTYRMKGIRPTRLQLMVLAGTRTTVGRSTRVQAAIDGSLVRLLQGFL